MPTTHLVIDVAGVADAGEILTLQRAAYVTQAQLHGDPLLPPLTETLDELLSVLSAGSPASPATATATATTGGSPTGTASAGRPQAADPGGGAPPVNGPTLVLVARLDTGLRIVGSVRARVDGDTCHIGRLIVVPDLQGRGIGSALLGEIERRQAGTVARFALFTGHLSEANLRLYRRLGYTETGLRRLTDHVTEVHLTKPALP